MKIVYLADVPEVIPTLTDWCVAEWELADGLNGSGDAGENLRACLNRDHLPLALVALDDDRHLVGTAALKTASVETHRHLEPWLAAVIVRRTRCRQKIAGALVEAIEDEARRLHYDALYAGTRDFARLLRRRGWQPFDETPSLGGAINICRLDLRAS